MLVNWVLDIKVGMVTLIHLVLFFTHLSPFNRSRNLTYNKNKIRLLERSTANHNTVSINGLNSPKYGQHLELEKGSKLNL